MCLQSYEELLDEMQRRKRRSSASPELVVESDSDSESDSSGEDSLQLPTARVLLVGARAVGKTTLLRSYLGQAGEVGPTQG